MKNLVIMLKAGDRIISYININIKNKDLPSIHHKLRLKEVIFGGTFAVYHPEMDFTNAINAGHKIIIDNRTHLGL